MSATLKEACGAIRKVFDDMGNYVATTPAQLRDLWNQLVAALVKEGEATALPAIDLPKEKIEVFVEFFKSPQPETRCNALRLALQDIKDAVKSATAKADDKTYAHKILSADLQHIKECWQIALVRFKKESVGTAIAKAFSPTVCAGMEPDFVAILDYCNTYQDLYLQTEQTIKLLASSF